MFLIIIPTITLAIDLDLDFSIDIDNAIAIVITLSSFLLIAVANWYQIWIIMYSSLAFICQ